MSEIDVSLFGSCVRPGLWESYLESLKSTSVSYEVIFSGFNTPEEVKPFLEKYPKLKYIHTGKIKPSQNYHLASIFCTGKTISWSCDDATYDSDVIGKAYKYWKNNNNEKLILSIQTKESGYGLPQSKLFDMNQHRFFGGNNDSPLMAPMNLMSRNFFNELGGYDRRYVAGQAENDLVLRAYTQGATVEIFGDETCYIDIDHLSKSIAIGESKSQEDFINRPFSKGYANDRMVLENSWSYFDQVALFKRLERGERSPVMREVSKVQLDQFEPYEDKDLYTKSQSNNLPEMWD